MTLLFTFLVALFLTTVLVPPLMRVASRLKLVDLPNPRKIHKVPTPLCGGIAVAAGALVPTAMWGSIDHTLIWSFAAVALIIVVGAIDDARPLHYGPRFLTQGIAVAIVIWAGVEFATLPFFGLDSPPRWICLSVTALFILGCTNAVNLADGLDGLAGGLTIPTLLAIMLLAYHGEGGTPLIVSAALIGAVSGFLRFNTYPATVFLGDAGSTFLGFSTSVLAILLVEHVHAALNPGIVLLLMGVPILDTLYAVVRRLASGHSPFLPDKRHLHHQLLALGLSQMQVVGALYALQGVMVLAGVVLRYESDIVVLGAFLAIALCVIPPLAYISARRMATASSALAQEWTPDNGVERRNLWLRRRKWLPTASLTAVKFGVGAFVVGAALAPIHVPQDMAVAALCVAGLWIGKMILVRRTSLPLLRLVIYASAGFAAFAIANATVGRPVLAWSVAIFLAILTAVLIIAIRVTRREQFSVTPQDLLVLFLALAVPNLSSPAIIEYRVREIVAIVILLFYATEFVLARDGNSRWGLDLAALVSLCLIGVSGFV